MTFDSTASSTAPRLLVVRNDKLGDFMLAWPALARLKAATPVPRISVLVPAYTAPMAHLCPWIDEVLIDPGEGADREAHQALLATVRERRFDALLTLFSTPRIGWLGWRAGIPLRLAPATKWAQLFYNRRVTQRRSRSRRPEYRYNQELAEALLDALGLTPNGSPAPPYWPLAEAERRTQRRRIATELDLDPATPWCFLHGGSGGSAVNLSPERYAELARAIDRRLEDEQRPTWILTAGPGEEATAEAIRASLAAAGVPVHRLPPRDGLDDFALSLAAADLFVAGSTGPLHIAGCLDIATAGFYPARRSATPLRWQTCNRQERRLAFRPPSDAGQQDMSRIDLEDAADAIGDLLLSFTHLGTPS
ncbi:glycosyltransferase family 9 protein [Halomonas ramblicola]|uniref:glycosyltransferase family 9 protein n=1 Tax=Halomonas ramblicola TaxID=747349 RepID=UPI0025B4D307|nr:glycosyltransferase family 9 protein [Halomonas ramblicola]MDN3522886.1 glycosyltransferase family 9 protein [Halomonas ramblicola]